MRCLKISSQGVSAVKRIYISRNNELVPTNTFIRTFCKPLLPDTIKIPIVPFIPNPLWCFKCHRYGQGGNACHGKVTCAWCGQVDHKNKTCTNAISCANCKGSHFAYSRKCPKWKQKKQVQQVRVKKQVLFPEARRLVDTRSGTVAGKSYATAVKVSTTNAWVQTDLTWPNGADHLKKQNLILKRHRNNQQQLFRSSRHLAHHMSLWILWIHTRLAHLDSHAKANLCQKRPSHIRCSEVFLLEQKETWDRCLFWPTQEGRTTSHPDQQ